MQQQNNPYLQPQKSLAFAVCIARRLYSIFLFLFFYCKKKKNLLAKLNDTG